MQLLKITILILLSNYTIIQGCASILGGTVDEQKKSRPFTGCSYPCRPYKEKSYAQELIANSVGYAVMIATKTKPPFIGFGGGYGVAINNSTQ
jgi:hypothetical protein